MGTPDIGAGTLKSGGWGHPHFQGSPWTEQNPVEGGIRGKSYGSLKSNSGGSIPGHGDSFPLFLCPENTGCVRFSGPLQADGCQERLVEEELGGDLVTFLPWFLSPSSREKHNDPSPEVTNRKASGAIGLTLFPHILGTGRSSCC